MSNTGNGDDAARDSQGRPMYDRFGRPIRRRNPNAQGAGAAGGSAGVPGGVNPNNNAGRGETPRGQGQPGAQRPAITRLTPEQLAAVRSGQPMSSVMGNSQGAGAQSPMVGGRQSNSADQRDHSASQQPYETQFLPHDQAARAASPYGQQPQAPYGEQPQARDELPKSPYGQQPQDPYPAGPGAHGNSPAGDPNAAGAVNPHDPLHRAQPVSYQPGAAPQQQGVAYGHGNGGYAQGTGQPGVQQGAQYGGHFASQHPPHHTGHSGQQGGPGHHDQQRSTRKFKIPGILRFFFKRGRRLRTLFTLLLVVVVILGGTAMWVDSKLPRIDALTDYAGRPSAGSGTNWLLVGSDSREGLTEAQQAELSTGGDTGGGRTDSIMIVHIPTVGKATVLSLPRDSYVNIPGYGKNKINAAFAFGGAQLLQQTVEEATGLHIDHYAEIGFGGFASIVDAVGGVNICVEQVMDDPLAGINLQPGCQTLNGANALGFVRSRHSMADGDIGRARNQRTFLAALTKKILSPGSLLNPFKFFPLVSNISASFTVNEDDHVWNLARLAWALARSPKTESAPVGGYASTDVGSVVLWDDAAAQELFASLR